MQNDSKPKQRTEKQREASRLNGSKSRGPGGTRTTSRTVAESVVHGRLARTVVLPGESRSRFDALVHSLEAELLPETAVERLLVHKMAVAHWRQMRVWQLEKTKITDFSPTQHAPLYGQFGAANPVARTPSSREQAPPSFDAVAMTDPANRCTALSHFEHGYDPAFTRALNSLSRLRTKRTANATAPLETKSPSTKLKIREKT